MIERCARCGREAPPHIEGPEGAAAQGWVTFGGDEVLSIAVPMVISILPLEVVGAIREHEGLVELVPLPDVTAPGSVEIHSAWLGEACPDCLAATGWDDDQWQLFMTGPDAKRGDFR
jgi:hypothetical protein